MDSIAPQTTDSPPVVENKLGGEVVKKSNASPMRAFHHVFAHSRISTAADSFVVTNMDTSSNDDTHMAASLKSKRRDKQL